MTPGLQRGPPFPKNATKGAVVAIASLEAPTIPMAVGTCVIDVSSLGSTQGMKGHAVETFHWAGDELWSWSTGNNPGRDPPALIEAWDEQEDEDTSLAERTAAVDLSDSDGGVLLDTDPTKRSKAEQAQGVEGEDVPSNKDFVDIVEDKELTTKGGYSGFDRRLHVLTNIYQKSMTPSRTPSSMAYGITWSRTEINRTLVSTFHFHNLLSWPCLSSLSYPLIHPLELLHYRSRNRVGRTSGSSSNTLTNKASSRARTETVMRLLYKISTLRIVRLRPSYRTDYPRGMYQQERAQAVN